MCINSESIDSAIYDIDIDFHEFDKKGVTEQELHKIRVKLFTHRSYLKMLKGLRRRKDIHDFILYQINPTKYPMEQHSKKEDQKASKGRRVRK